MLPKQSTMSALDFKRPTSNNLMLSTGGSKIGLGSKIKVERIDKTLLSTGRLPDIEPIVPVDNYINYKYTSRRGATTINQDRANRVLQNKAQLQLEKFEKKLQHE